MNNKIIISQQIERGIMILRCLNDLVEVGVDKQGLPHIQLFEGQRFYDEEKIGILETQVQNWKTESEICLNMIGITLDNDNPFQMQSSITRTIDKRKALVDEIQTGIQYLRSLLDITIKCEHSQEDAIHHLNLGDDAQIHEDKASPSSDIIIKQAIKIMKEEKVIKNLYDYAFIMMIMNDIEDCPSFDSPKSFLTYLRDINIMDLPREDSVKKKISVTFGKHPSWYFRDSKGQDATEAKRRNNVASRFLSIYRKGK